jgi:hypothetical protein
MTTFNYVPRSDSAWERRAHQNYCGEPTTTSIIDAIRKARGKLKVSARGHLTLTGERIPEELFEALQAKKEEITAVLVAKKEQAEAAKVIVAPMSTGQFVETRKRYLACVSCSHLRSQHCTKRKIKLGEVPSRKQWKGFKDDDGQIQACSHTLPDAQPYFCSSAACAVVLGEGEAMHYCPCQKFESPNKKKRPPKVRAPEALAAEPKFGTLIPQSELLAIVKTKENMLLAAAADPASDLMALSPAQIAEIVDLTETQVKRILKKVGLLPTREKTGFVTGVHP